MDHEHETEAGNVNVTEVTEITITLVGTPADSFARKVRKRMPTLRRAADLACDELRKIIEERAGKGVGMRFTVIGTSRVLSADEKRALLREHKAGDAG